MCPQEPASAPKPVIAEVRCAPAPATPKQAEAVLAFWFGLAPIAWFKRDAEVDAQIHQRFAHLVQQALAGDFLAWADTPRGRLALILVLDQFPRNLFRNSPKAFAGDARAQSLATEGVSVGYDRSLTPVQRVFFVLPWEHAEDLNLQAKMVAYLKDLEAQAPAAGRQAMAMYRDYAERHHAVVAKFGRFPHRNGVLGRTSTPAEKTYLAKPGSGF